MAYLFQLLLVIAVMTWSTTLSASMMPEAEDPSTMPEYNASDPYMPMSPAEMESINATAMNESSTDTAAETDIGITTMTQTATQTATQTVTMTGASMQPAEAEVSSTQNAALQTNYGQAPGGTITPLPAAPPPPPTGWLGTPVAAPPAAPAPVPTQQNNYDAYMTWVSGLPHGDPSLTVRSCSGIQTTIPGCTAASIQAELEAGGGKYILVSSLNQPMQLTTWYAFVADPNHVPGMPSALQMWLADDADSVIGTKKPIKSAPMPLGALTVEEMVAAVGGAPADEGGFKFVFDSVYSGFQTGPQMLYVKFRREFQTTIGNPPTPPTPPGSGIPDYDPPPLDWDTLPEAPESDTPLPPPPAMPPPPPPAYPNQSNTSTNTDTSTTPDTYMPAYAPPLSNVAFTVWQNSVLAQGATIQGCRVNSACSEASVRQHNGLGADWVVVGSHTSTLEDGTSYLYFAFTDTI